MTAAGITILILLAALLLEGVVLGIWIWARGRRLAEEAAARCVLAGEVDRLQRAAEIDVEEDRVDELTADEVLAELLSNPDLDSGAR